ncbi:metallopeptidase family protein [Knoellia sp. CPCC 206450]|uniref:metallopeptidase family protein n=1 Tax=Knoellia tibetensis TaxID=3404798 RepID=UPI003B43ABD0
MEPVAVEEFEAIVEEALDDVPEELMGMLDNVVFLVEDEPPADDPDLLGVYDGVPLTERDSGWGLGNLPDRITLFRGPLTRMCKDLEDLREEIAVTVVHEIAHHFGIDDATLHELGWG